MHKISIPRWLENIGLNCLFLILSVAIILTSVAFWMYAYYPRMGHDYSAWLPQIFESQLAWKEYGRIVYDFSPFRCLGLPTYSHPNTLQLSLFHFIGLLTNEVMAIYLVLSFLLVFSFLGAFLLCRKFGLERAVSILLALGWILQGWIVVRTLVGHVPFIHLALAPWILFALISKRNYWWLLATAFWLSHMLYSAAFYTNIILFISVALSLLVLYFLRMNSKILDWRTVFQNAALVIAAVALISLPKVVGSLDFLALFPREIALEHASATGSLVYILANLFWPFPYNINRLTGWSYGPWEAYQFLMPLLFPILAVVLFRHRSTINWQRILLVFSVLIAISLILVSGALGGLFSMVPILKSLHVNPRWNAIILLPMFLLVILVIRQTGFLSAPDRATRLGLVFFFLSFSVTPLVFVPFNPSWSLYPYKAGINPEYERVGFCYEPIFGYRLETFPGMRGGLDWLREPLRDPRCLLKSGHCRPGTALKDQLSVVKLASFATEQPNWFVRVFRPFSLVIYLVAFVAMIGTFLKMAVLSRNSCK